ncbi:MAG: biotin transporter BioY, partial [Melioribacteraceae bacterium]|nr:biotin transporter BioY [Melioribacteraceae bacterium]
PIFANFGFGFAKIFGPTGGYLLSFPFAAYLVGYILEKRRNKVTIAISFFAGNLMIILTGALFLSLFFNGDFQAAFYSGAAIFSIWGLVKVSLAIAAYYTISKKVSKLP